MNWIDYKKTKPLGVHGLILMYMDGDYEFGMNIAGSIEVFRDGEFLSMPADSIITHWAKLDAPHDEQA